MYAGAEPCPVVILPIALTTLQGAYYHSDHLGSAELITDCQGREYQWIEYTPYGETWVEKKGDGNYGTQYLPYTFTGKEQDKARTIAGVLCAGLYYYGARYLDPKYSRWISCDPALGEYIPVAPTNDEAKKHNSNLPGNGGVFNAINLHLYHYAGNNPVRYNDPDGAFDWDEGKTSGSVQRNDTLSEVTKEFNDKNGTNVDYNDVAAANGIKDPDKIKPGQKLDFSSFLPNNNSDQNKGQVPEINTSLISASQKNEEGYSRGSNIIIGITEILGGSVVAVGSVIGAAAIDVYTGGITSAQTGWAALGGWASGSTFVAFGITRLTNANKAKVSDDIKSVFIPSVVDIAQEMDNSTKEKKQ